MNQKKVNGAKSGKEFKLQMLATILAAFVATLFVSGTYVLFFDKDESKIERPDGYMSEEEKIELGNYVSSLYSSESAPSAPEGKDPFNYGLEEEPASGERPEGSLVFSGRKIRETSRYTQLYSLDLGDASSSPELLIPEYFSSAMAEFVDADAPEDFYALTVSEYSLDKEPDGVGIHLYDSEAGTVQPFTSATGNYERSIAWAPETGFLAFSRLKVDRKTDIDLLTLDNWETVVIDTKTDKLVAIIGGALYPQWSPDGLKVLFLKTEGLYLYDLEKQVEQEVVGLPEGGIAIASSMIDVSADGKYALWTTAKEGMITLYEIVSWDSIELKEVGRMQVEDTEFFWPVFSPDGNYYSVQAIDTLKGNDFVRKNARIEVRPLESRTVVAEFSLDDFFFDALFSDDWIAKTTAQ